MKLDLLFSLCKMQMWPWISGQLHLLSKAYDDLFSGFIIV